MCCEDVQCCLMRMCVGLVLGAWCSFSGGGGWLCACDLCAAPLEGEGSIAGKIWQPTQVCVSLLHVVRCAQVAAFCASRSDDGWLCACLQSLWKGNDPLQARGAANATLYRSCTAAQMSFVALELLLCPLLAGMMAGCVLVCSTCWSGRMHCLA